MIPKNETPREASAVKVQSVLCPGCGRFRRAERGWFGHLYFNTHAAPFQSPCSMSDKKVRP